MEASKDLDEREVLSTVGLLGYWAIDALGLRYPRKVVVAKYRKLMDKDLLDYGTNEYHPFLTDKGREMVATRGSE